MTLPTTTRAWTYSGPFPRGLKLSTISVPHPVEDASAQDSLIVRVTAAALNPVDIQLMNLPRGFFERGKREERGIGFDFAGVVLTAPKDSGHRVGDEIMGTTSSPLAIQRGTLAEVAVLDAKATVAVGKPQGWTHAQAAAIPLVWLTAKTSIESVPNYLTMSKPKVVVLGGSSATGIYSIMLAKRQGWTILSTSSAKNKDFLISSLGVDEHVDYTKNDVRQKVTKFQPDAIIDCVGGTECIGIAGNRRYITIVGDKVSRDTMGGPYVYYDLRHPINAVSQWIRWVKGHVGLGESYDIVHLEYEKNWLQEAPETLSTKDIFIDSVHPFERADEAYERLDTGRAKGKVVVEIGA